MTNQYGITPLHYSCYFGNKQSIDLLLDLDANINKQDTEGNTPLHFAINSGDIRTVKKLLIRGADKSIKRNDGMTPYDLAIESNQIEASLVLKKLNFIRKYIFMQSELEPFKKSRNDLFLLVTFLAILTFKLIYILKGERIYNSNLNNVNLYVSCLAGKD